METRLLAVRLTDDELSLRGEQLATKVKERKSVDSERKDHATRFRSDLKSLDVEITKLATVVKDRKEIRPVDCRWEENWTRFAMELVRLDTGERVDARPMTAEEKQTKLFGEDEESPTRMEMLEVDEEEIPETQVPLKAPPRKRAPKKAKADARP